MAQNIMIPQFFPYSDGFVAYGAACSIQPPGQPRWGSFQFAWANVTAEMPGYMVDMTQYPQMPKEIATLFVDNSRSSQGVVIIFPDTGFKLIVSPYRRGFYSVLSKSARFYIGVMDTTRATDCFTYVGACNFFVPPQEEEVRIERKAILFAIDPAINIIHNVAGTNQLLRLRSGYLVMSNITAGAAGFSAIFQIEADGLPIMTINVTLQDNEFIDGRNLWPAPNMEIDIGASSFAVSWTVTAGAVIAGGTMDLGMYFDFCPGI